jgi:hypothetical protein
MIVYLDLIEMLKASKYALTLDELRKRLVLRRDAIGKALDAARADYEQTIREGETELEELNRALTAFAPPPADAPVFRTDVGGTPIENPDASKVTAELAAVRDAWNRERAGYDETNRVWMQRAGDHLRRAETAERERDKLQARIDAELCADNGETWQAECERARNERDLARAERDAAREGVDAIVEMEMCRVPAAMMREVDQMAGERLVDTTALAKRFEEAVREALEKTLKETLDAATALVPETGGKLPDGDAS